jgi:formylmethanofuran dehydrogenase subunit E
MPIELIRPEPVECPHCAEPTMPNRLADGSIVCSCAAERSLPPPPTPLDSRRTPPR